MRRISALRCGNSRSFTVSKLPQVILARLKLLASPHFTKIGIRAHLCTSTAFALLVYGNKVAAVNLPCSAQICNPSPHFTACALPCHCEA